MPAGAIMGSSLISGYFNYRGAQEGAASTQYGYDVAAAQQEADRKESYRRYMQGRADTAPWRTAGQGAINAISQMYGIPMGADTTIPSQYTPAATPARPESGGLIPGADDLGLPSWTQQSVGIPGTNYSYGNVPGSMMTTSMPSGSLQQPGGQQPGDQNANMFAAAGQPQTATGGAPGPGGTFESPFNVYERFDPGEFEASPGYAHRVEQGTRGMESYLGSSGMRLSGRALKEMERYRQGEASQEYGNWYSRQMAAHQQRESDKQNYIARLFQTAGMGTGAVNTAVNMPQQTYDPSVAMNYGTNMANIRQQEQAGYNNAVQGGMANWMAYQQQQRQNQAWQDQSYRNNPALGDAYMPAYQ